ncbi:uncharacterized protein LOC106883075 isoform X2 [Octopus bimaculoides]|uniref:Uncharacterized protein LOC115210808 isoform X2 n=1 Tax=Octopus sinensis TaxID=2607531 RepID=A0A6P7SAP5_9MOLL|nr:uncharacterized protein LOC106883075 isoform X2 [Octopus bimaculoides]XP_029635414.1 uncharacterized protein LOC115210808 isoform X2 [Octopus sinensis]|eukprot:XP_014789458.1 PREDICTED: uncharacterized protein LOC106883075 isoform X2 [Octopus bimaculoides]
MSLLFKREKWARDRHRQHQRGGQLRMGADESKAGRYDLMGASAVVGNMRRMAEQAQPWALLHQCSLEQWKCGHAEATGFGDSLLTCDGLVFKDCSPAFCTSRQGIIDINKSNSFFSFRRRSKFIKMAEHFEYNHIPAQLSSIQNFHVKSVLCYHDNLVILHLVQNMMTQFGVIDLSINKFLGHFGKQNVEFVNEALWGELSSDDSTCLIKFPNLRGDNSASVFQLYNIKTKQLISEVSLPYSHSLFAFDPRFGNLRLAVTSFRRDEDNSLSLVRTDIWETVSFNTQIDVFRDMQRLKLKNLVYSKDGLLIFAIMMTGGCFCREKKSRKYNALTMAVYVFDGDTSQTLYCIQYIRFICGLHSCPVNFMPVFSNCGDRMALVLNVPDSSTDHIHVYKLPNKGNLQNRCRTRILQYFSPEMIPRLPLPQKLLDYLQFKPEYVQPPPLVCSRS